MNLHKHTIYAAIYEDGRVVSHEEGEAIGTFTDVQDGIRYGCMGQIQEEMGLMPHQWDLRTCRLPARVSVVKLSIDSEEVYPSEMEDESDYG